MNDEVRIEQSDPRPLAVVHRRAALHELSRVVPDACGEVWSVLRAQQVAGLAGRNVAVYLDDVINLEVGVEFGAPYVSQGAVVSSNLPAGTVAAATHFGPYERLSEAHQAIRRWCVAHGYSPAGPNWEIYGHWIDAWVSDPSKIRTDVYYLLNS